MTSQRPYRLVPGKVNLSSLRAIYYNEVELSLDQNAINAVIKSQETIQEILSSNQVIYGINTGLGKLVHTRIPPDKLSQLQRNLILTRCVAVGELLPDNVTRLIIACKVISLSRGHSGIRLSLIEALLSLYNAGVMPCIPEKGSVGASGDLAPLAHLSLMLLGEGQVRLSNGQLVSALEGLSLAGVQPVELGPKEGVALVNGTQVSTALALAGLFEAERVFAAGLIAGALTLEAVKGSIKAYDSRIHEARGQLGQIAVAKTLCELLKDSEIILSHAGCKRVQDPYSLRCVPQVMGACLDNLRHAARTLTIEANATSDNPLVFSETREVISGGNFHAEPVAFAADIIALSLAEIGSISERRIALLMDTGMSGLPAFLVPESGVNSGFMVAQVTAAALVSENKSLAHPASVDSIPTSANQEDHVSMATFGARRLRDMCFNVSIVVAIEAMTATQGIDLHETRERSSVILEEQIAEIRRRVTFMQKDRLLSPDIEAMRLWVTEYNWPQSVLDLLPSYDEADSFC